MTKKNQGYGLQREYSHKVVVEREKNVEMRWTGQEVRLALLQLSIMFGGGVGLLEALETLKSNASEDKRRVLDSILYGIESGRQFSVTLAQHPNLFPKTVIELIRIGEETGALAVALRRAAEWMDTQERLRKKLISVIRYPVIVIVVAGLANLAILKCCLPQLLKMLQEFGVTPPLLSRIVFGLGALLVDARFLLLLQGLIILVWIRRKYILNEKRREWLEAMVLRTPYLSPLFRASTQARIAHSLSLGLATGVDTVKCLEISLRACGSRIFAGAFDETKHLIEHGSSLTEAFKSQEKLFTPIFWQYLEAGEQVGKVSVTCAALAKQMENEFEYRVSILGAVVEPLLLAASSVVVGTVVIATFLPLQQFIHNLM